MKIRFLYHRGKDSWLGKGIIVWTWLLAVARLDFKSLKFNFSHVEVWFPDEDGNFKGVTRETPARFRATGMYVSPLKFPPLGQCFSSTTRGDSKGVRFAPASEVLHHPERWVYQEFELEVHDDYVNNYKTSLQELVGKKYDFWGIAGFFFPINFQDKNKWFCSEICAYIAYDFWIIKEKHKRISPRRLAKVLGGKLNEVKK